MADNQELIEALMADPNNRQTLMQRYAPNLDWMPETLKEYLRQAPIALMGLSPALRMPAGGLNPTTITGGNPGNTPPPNYTGPAYGPDFRQSSAGMAHYNPRAIRDARTGDPLPNPHPNYKGAKWEEAMMSDMTADIAKQLKVEQPSLADIQAMSPYDRAVLQQGARGERFQSVPGGRDFRGLKPGNENY